jgi:hypothetical protein
MSKLVSRASAILQIAGPRDTFPSSNPRSVACRVDRSSFRPLLTSGKDLLRLLSDAGLHDLKSDNSRLYAELAKVAQPTNESRAVATTDLPKDPPWADDMLVSYGDAVVLPFPGSVAEMLLRNDFDLITRKVSSSEELDYASGQNKWALLHWAAWKGNDAACDYLLSRGANANAGDANRLSPLHIAAMYGHASTARHLLDHGATVDARDRWGRTPLHVAVASERCALVDTLLNNGAAINAVDKFGATPLQSAVYSPAVVELLLSRGADHSIRSRRGETALQAAIRLRSQLSRGPSKGDIFDRVAASTAQKMAATIAVFAHHKVME